MLRYFCILAVLQINTKEATYWPPLILVFYTMNKLLTLILPLFACSTVWAECSSGQKATPIELDVKYIPNGTKAAGNYGYMDQVIIQAQVE